MWRLLPCLLLWCPAEAGSRTSNTVWKEERRGKFLFNVLRFTNDVCDAGDGEEGVCYTGEECTGKGGIQAAPCAAGFGVCCLFRASGEGGEEMMGERVTYFTNKEWPLTGSSLQFATHSVRVTDTDVCQIRLDFLNFTMAGPSLSHFPIGECDSDRLTIFTLRQQLGLSGGNQLCGEQGGQHVYLTVDSLAQLDPIRLFAFVGNPDSAGASSSYSWNIKVTQLDCTENSQLQAPPGCLQYFPHPVGTFQSFNYGGGPGSPYLANTRYAVCFRASPGSCRLRLTSSTGQFVLNSNYFSGSSPNGTINGSLCHSDLEASNNDFLQVLGGWTLASDGSSRRSQAYFCGGDNTTTVPDIHAEGGPHMVLVSTDEGVRYAAGDLLETTATQAAKEDLINQRERGFRISYSINPC